MPFPQMNANLARALAERGYEEPTAVQSAVLTPEAEGRDLLVSAQTGSGKTVAFGVALATTLLGDAERFGAPGLPLALIVAPTRELALQVQRELEWLYGPAGGRIASCVGGMDIRREAKALASGCHIVVGTPGRLKDHIQRKRLELSGLKAVVLDEADEMLDLGFREDLEYILGATPTERRTLLFSATIAQEIATLAKTFQRDAVRIQTINHREAHADIDYRAIRVVGHEVERAIVNVLRFYDTGATLVFCSTREGVKRLHGSLLERGFAAVALSGELSQAERSGALQSLRDGRSRVCVATDVAARGLDLPNLDLVIHADLPNDRETLLHRSGRTGRAGRKGICLLMVPPMKRRRAEMLIRAANVNATWGPPPSADEVRGKDQERMLNDVMFGEDMTDEDLVIAKAMLEKRTPEDVALALVRVLRSRLPAPEDVTDPGSGTFKDRKPADRWEKDSRGPRDGKPFEKRSTYSTRDSDYVPSGDADRGPPRDRLKPEETVWFRINVGRNRNAEPRWMIPLICKAGGITKAEIGSIRIFDNDSRFQIAKDKAEAFAESVKGKNENNTTITQAFGPEDRANSTPRPEGGNDDRPFKKAPYQPAFKPKRDFGDTRGSSEPRFSEPRPQDDRPARADGDRPAPRNDGEWEKKPFKKPFHAKKDFGKDGGKGDWVKKDWGNKDAAKKDYAPKSDTKQPYAKPFEKPAGEPREAAENRHTPPRSEGDAPRPFKKPFAHKGKPFSGGGDKPFVKPYKAKKKQKAQ
ncbi:MAG: DEAD/DEAH box helicase [Hyphomicrobiaceae bacterium]